MSGSGCQRDLNGASSSKISSMTAIAASPDSKNLEVLTPTSPTTVNKPVSIAPTPGSTFLTNSFTQKEWVIPPRPKPGRKPAGDAPPTKRKAQNREAQRAFRERRAAKVGELEDQLKALEDEHEKENTGLRYRIEEMQQDLQLCTDQISSWRGKHHELEIEFRKERQSRIAAEIEVQTLQKNTKAQTEAVALPLRKNNTAEYLDVEQVPMPEQDAPIDDLTCGRCNRDSRCQCIEEAFEMANGGVNGDNATPTKRSHSPYTDPDSKRVCQSQEDENEIDFTAKFSTRQAETGGSNLRSVPFQAPMPLEPCGFCNDGSTCICAELNLQTMQRPSLAPPPSRPSRSNIAISQSSAMLAGCTNDPGNCNQCRADPTSTLFCKTLAASRPLPTSRRTSDTTSEAQRSRNENSTATSGHTLTCADAYTTLSRHHAFPQASTELGSWVSQLSAVPGVAKTEGMTAFEIEAASVMSVLKFFDNRFGPKPKPAMTDSNGELQEGREVGDGHSRR